MEPGLERGIAGIIFVQYKWSIIILQIEYWLRRRKACMIVEAEVEWNGAKAVP